VREFFRLNREAAIPIATWPMLGITVHPFDALPIRGLGAAEPALRFYADVSAATKTVASMAY
jgi:hypothetical protein